MFLKCFRLFYIKDNSVEYLIDFIKTRGSQEPVIAHLVFNVTSIENGGVTHNFESEPPKDHFNSNF